jgi:hypothetical protein
MGIMQSISSQIDAILRAETELAQKDDPSLIVRSAFEVIEDFLSRACRWNESPLRFKNTTSKSPRATWCVTSASCVKNAGLQAIKKRQKPKTPDVSTWLQQRQACKVSRCVRHGPKRGALPCPGCRCSIRHHRSHTSIAVSQAPFPDDITRLKFIEVKGEWLDVTKMNIDDYLTVSKTIPDQRKNPDGMFDIIAAENRIRGMYERAYCQYDAAIAKWKSSQ